ncbi:MAG: DUF1931 domain-containing protein [Nanoarchaeota archaeon]
MLIVKSKIKEIVGNFNVSSDFADALDNEVLKLVKKAITRAESNGRKTIMAKDL